MRRQYSTENQRCNKKIILVNTTWHISDKIGRKKRLQLRVETIKKGP
jgi:hypothetical protein